MFVVLTDIKNSEVPLKTLYLVEDPRPKEDTRTDDHVNLEYSSKGLTWILTKSV